MSEHDAAEVLTRYELAGNRLSPKRMRIEIGGGELEVGRQANPVEFFLAGVLGCVNSTGTMVARDMDLEIDDLTAVVTGSVDYAAYRGEQTESRPGLQQLAIRLDVSSTANEAALQAWVTEVKARCPVTDNVENETPLTIDLQTHEDSRRE